MARLYIFPFLARVGRNNGIQLLVNRFRKVFERDQAFSFSIVD